MSIYAYLSIIFLVLICLFSYLGKLINNVFNYCCYDSRRNKFSPRSYPSKSKRNDIIRRILSWHITVTHITFELQI